MSIYQYDKRSRKNLFLSNIEWRECRDIVKSYMEKGYGFQIVPPLEYMSNDGRNYLLYSLANLAHEMIRRGHEVVFLKRRGVESDVEHMIREMRARGVEIEIKEC